MGIVTALILHYHRNTFEKIVFMSKRVQSKIKAKHSDMFIFTEQTNFTRLMEATVAYCPYDEHTINFIAHIDNKYVLYSLKREKHHTICNTIFALRADTLRTYFRDDNFKVVKNGYEEIIAGYIKA